MRTRAAEHCREHQSPGSPGVGRWLVPAAGVLLALIILYGTIVKIYDADLFWHLRTGQLILDTNSVPRTDPYSVTAAGKRWIAQEWLWEVIAHSIWHVSGFAGLSLVRTMAVAGAIVLAMFAARRQGVGWLSVLLSASVLALPLIAYAEIRPQVATFFMFGLLVYLLEAGRERPILLRLLPILFLIWANLHGAFLIGFVLIGCEVLAAYLESRRSSRRRGAHIAADTSRFKSLLAVGAISLAAGLINPAGYGIYLYPLLVITEPMFRARVYEWVPPDLSQPFWPFWAVLALTVLLVVRNRLPLRHWVTLIAFALLALRARRQAPFFCLVAIAPVAAAFESFLAFNPRSRSVLALSGALLLALFTGYCYHGFRGAFGIGLTPGRFPEEAVRQVAATGKSGAIFNDYNDGGYLIWKLWPQWKIAMDGRVDVYGPEMVQRYARIWHGAPGWEKDFNKWNIQVVLGRREIWRSSPKQNLYTELAKNLEWTQAYRDSASELWIRK